MKSRVNGRLGSAGMLPRRNLLAATATGLEPRKFVIPENAVNGIVIGTGALIGLLGWQERDRPFGLFLISVGGGLGALGLAFFVRELFTKLA